MTHSAAKLTHGVFHTIETKEQSIWQWRVLSIIGQVTSDHAKQIEFFKLSDSDFCPWLKRKILPAGWEDEGVKGSVVLWCEGREEGQGSAVFTLDKEV